LIAVTTDLEGLHVGEGWTLVKAHQVVLTGCGDEERSARLEGATAIQYKHVLRDMMAISMGGARISKPLY